MRERNCVAFYNSGNVAYTRLVEGRATQETWNHRDGKTDEVIWTRELSRTRFERGGSQFDPSGLRTFHWMENDTMEFALRMRSPTDTISFHFTDLEGRVHPLTAYTSMRDVSAGKCGSIDTIRHHLFHELYRLCQGGERRHTHPVEL
ncbi:MAG: hypothetical protein IPI55_03040 [Flavobacteriales bacterium]|nr:hypothetical protein [Flavobacteriales bacterium]